MKLVVTGRAVTMLILCGGCASQQYRQEAVRVQSINPHFALEYAAKALVADPDDQSNADVTRTILGAIAEDHRNRVKEMDNSGDYEGAVVDCDRVLASADFAKKFHGKFNLPYDEGERKDFAEKAAEKYYKQAQEFEGQKQLREAVDAYCRCRSFRINYKNTEQAVEALKEASIIRMFVSQKVTVPGSGGAVNQLATSLPQLTGSYRPRFLVFIQDQGKATSSNEVTISDLSFTDAGWVARQDKNAVQTPYKDQYGVQHVKNYAAVWTLYTREIACFVTAGYSVTTVRQGDPSGAGSSSKTSNWTGRYVQWSGDEQALPAELKQLPNSPPAAPSQTAMVSDAMRPISRDLASQLFQNYK